MPTRMKNTHYDRPASGPTTRQMPSHIISPHLTRAITDDTSFFLPLHEPAGLAGQIDLTAHRPRTTALAGWGPSRSAIPR